MQFIPEKPAAQSLDNVPYFEDIKASDVAGRGTEKSIKALQQEIITWLSKLNATWVTFTPGNYPSKKGSRYGFQITFTLGQLRGRIDCAGLPMRTFTDRKKDRATAQALFLLRDELKAAHFSSIYKPNGVPLLPYILDNNGQTLTESIVNGHEFKSLMSSNAG